MGETYTGGCDGDAIQNESRGGVGLGAADWLRFAAAPTLAIMALLTDVFGRGSPSMICSATPGASPLSGMVMMYLMMSVFHSSPWLKLISSRRSGSRRA
jgi:hypothetical protein